MSKTDSDITGLNALLLGNAIVEVSYVQWREFYDLKNCPNTKVLYRYMSYRCPNSYVVNRSVFGNGEEVVTFFFGSLSSMAEREYGKESWYVTVVLLKDGKEMLFRHRALDNIEEKHLYYVEQFLLNKL